MKLHPPFFISDLLLPAIKVGDATISMGDLRLPEGASHRCRLDFYIDRAEGQYTGDLGVLWNTPTQSCFETVLSFLAAAAEAGPDSDNADLFPPHVMEWAADNVSEIETMLLTVQENTNLIKD